MNSNMVLMTLGGMGVLGIILLVIGMSSIEIISEEEQHLRFHAAIVENCTDE